MGLFRSSEIIGIAGDTLSFVLNAAEETHPREYMGFLRTEHAGKLGLDRDGRVITDVLVIPGTGSDRTSASVDKNMQPNSPGTVGSVHSHPSGVIRPSGTDLETFTGGELHIILGEPYGWNDWQAFDRHGDPVDLPVLDVDLPEDEFFERTREALEKRDEKSGGILSWFR